MCVRLVTTHGRPFALIQDAAFQEIVNIAVPSNARSKEINSNIIKGMIPEKAYQIRSKIRADVRNKMVSLKLDSATYLDRHFLGINLQSIEKGKITIRNLALLEVMERPTWELMKETLLEVLTDFTIDSSQIYSITTDNTNDNNFQMMTKLNTQHCCETQDVDDIDEESSCDENEQSEDDAHSDYIKEELNLENIASALSNGEFKPRAIFCVVHSLQLAVKDAIDHNVSVQMTINTARQAVMVLRRPNWKNLFRSSDLKNPIIDCPTRWTSTYRMLVRLHSFKGMFGEHRALSIYSEDFWAEIVDIITCLKPLNEATVALQREQLTISDFYIEWLNCRTKVEAMGTTFAGDLVQSMKEKERVLMDKDCVLENLYLDGRINIMLSDQECVKAKSLLCQTFRQLQMIASSEAGPSGMITPSTSHDDENDMHNISDLERMLQQTEKIRRLPQSFMEGKFEENLNKLRLEPRLPLSKNIIDHWHNIDASDTSLKKVASCVLAAPASQISVERLFKSVKFILNPLRTDIGGSLLQDILIIRANHDLLE